MSGTAELRDERAVAELDQAVHDRLRVDQHVDLLGGQREQMMGLDEFQALVHQGRGIDRDLRAHRPVRMLERLLHGCRSLIASALAVRNGPPDAVRITRRTSSRRLPLIAWNSALCSESTGSTVAPAAAARAHEQAAGADQRFLVGESDDRAALGRGQRRLEAGRAGDRADHPFGRTLRRLDQRALARARLDAGPRQRILELGVGGRIADRRKARAEVARERGKRGERFVLALTASTR